MELRHLHTFKVVAEVKGFTRAAEILGYAQSSITAQIQALEKELGTPLFDRLGKKVVLTDAGHRLLPYAQEMIKLQTAIKEAVQMDGIPTGTLTIGAPESLAAYRLPPIIQEYKQKFPQVKIILRPSLCWELRNQIRNGDIDLAFLLEPFQQIQEFHIETLVTERMGLIAPLDHPLAKAKTIELTDLRDETFLQTEPGCSYRRLFEQYLHNHGVTASTTMEFWNIEAIKNCVMSGLGIALLPLITVAKELKAKKLALLNWEEPTFQVDTQLVYHKGKWITPAIREFLKIVRKHAEAWRS